MGMEAASRWETEAIRESRDRRRARPAVSQQRTTSNPDGDWRTLREASEETGIPVGTLRKWCRRESVNSYLESDGEQTLRMLEMGSVEEHARATGRDLAKGESREATGDGQQAEEGRPTPVASPQPEPIPTTGAEVGTMIVPVDAWSKMLNQLGNLHEAGQQLAEARERAGKAETEAMFLRERLAEMREERRQATGDRQRGEGRQQATGDRQQEEPAPVPAADPSASSSPSGGGAERSEAEGVEESDPSETTSFWRYVVRGWRGRRR
jgi:hypothetical protein